MAGGGGRGAPLDVDSDGILPLYWLVLCSDDGGGILSNAWTRLKDILGLQ